MRQSDVILNIPVKWAVARVILGAVMGVAFSLTQLPMVAAKVTISPAPDGEALSDIFKTQVDGHDVPTYPLQVAPQDKTLRIEAVEHKSLSGVHSEEAAFTYFDTDGVASVSVTYKEPVTFARLLPESAATPVKIQGKMMQFQIKGPQDLTLEVNHQIVRTLHIFANPPETGAPDPHAPNVLFLAPGAHQMNSFKMPQGKTIFYFGPGVHTVDNLLVQDGQTVYIAGGAVVRSVIRDGEPSTNDTYNNETIRLYVEPAIKLLGAGIKVRGRGILDGTPSLGKRLLRIEGQDISLEGIILKNSGNWFMPIWYSDRVTVTNLKILGYRANSDGIDIYSSRDVVIENCFIRTVDDVVVVKSKARNRNALTDGDRVKNITVKGNQLWNETGSAMKIGTEVEADISTVTFISNDVVHDLARGFSEDIYLAGSGTVSNVRFEGNRIDRSGNLYDWGGASKIVEAVIGQSLWEGAAEKQHPPGKIRGVLYSDTQVKTSPQNAKMRVDLTGASATSDIEAVTFHNVQVNGTPLSKTNSLVQQKFVTNVTGLP